jgi:hypothetical protein
METSTQTAWNILNKGEKITTVFFNSNCTPQDVKRSLIEFDGFPYTIQVVRYKQ